MTDNQKTKGTPFIITALKGAASPYPRVTAEDSRNAKAEPTLSRKEMHQRLIDAFDKVWSDQLDRMLALSRNQNIPAQDNNR